MRPPPCHERALARVTLCDTEEDRDKILLSITEVLKSEGPLWENGPAWPVPASKPRTTWRSPRGQAHRDDLNARFKEERPCRGCWARSPRRPEMLPRAKCASRSLCGTALGTDGRSPEPCNRRPGPEVPLRGRGHARPAPARAPGSPQGHVALSATAPRPGAQHGERGDPRAQKGRAGPATADTLTGHVGLVPPPRPRRHVPRGSSGPSRPRPASCLSTPRSGPGGRLVPPGRASDRLRPGALRVARRPPDAVATRRRRRPRESPSATRRLGPRPPPQTRPAARPARSGPPRAEAPACGDPRGARPALGPSGAAAAGASHRPRRDGVHPAPARRPAPAPHIYRGPGPAAGPGAGPGSAARQPAPQAPESGRRAGGSARRHVSAASAGWPDQGAGPGRGLARHSSSGPMAALLGVRQRETRPRRRCPGSRPRAAAPPPAPTRPPLPVAPRVPWVPGPRWSRWPAVLSFRPEGGRGPAGGCRTPGRPLRKMRRFLGADCCG